MNIHGNDSVFIKHTPCHIQWQREVGSRHIQCESVVSHHIWGLSTKQRWPNLQNDVTTLLPNTVTASNVITS